MYYDKYTTARKIKEARVARNLTQKEISDLIKINVNKYKNIEQGYLIPGADVLLAISEATSYPIAHFVSYRCQRYVCIH